MLEDPNLVSFRQTISNLRRFQKEVRAASLIAVGGTELSCVPCSDGCFAFLCSFASESSICFPQCVCVLEFV